MIISPVITIDGPSGSGKSSLCRALAKHLKWFNLESGLIYRILACLFLKKNIPMIEKCLIPVLHDLDVYFLYKDGMISNLIKKEFSYKYIMSQKVTDTSSQLASIPYIRNYLLLKQRLFRQKPGLVADGRDMGTVVFPDAKIKFFLKATLKARAYRRMLDLKKQGFNINYEDLIDQIKKRDYRDENRIHSPLKAASDAIILNSSDITLTEMIEIAIKYIKNSYYFKIKSFYN